MRLIRGGVRVGAAALTAATLATGCGAAGNTTATTHTATTHTKAAAPATKLSGEAARAAHAVRALDRAIRAGDVRRLCRRDAIFTAAVVEEMRSGGMTCEAAVEDLLAAPHPPRAAVASVAVKPRLATAQVRVSPSRTVPLTLLRAGHRWLVSFSHGTSPLVALAS